MTHSWYEGAEATSRPVSWHWDLLPGANVYDEVEALLRRRGLVHGDDLHVTDELVANLSRQLGRRVGWRENPKRNLMVRMWTTERCIEVRGHTPGGHLPAVFVAYCEMLGESADEELRACAALVLSVAPWKVVEG